MTFSQKQDFTQIPSAEPQADGTIELPALLLSGQLPFPKMLSLLPLTSESGFAAVLHAKAHHQTLIAVKCRSENSRAALEHLHSVGMEIAPGRVADHSENSPAVMVQGRRRLKIIAIRQPGPYPIATAQPIADRPADPSLIAPLMADALELFKHASDYQQALPEAVIQHILALDDPGVLCDALASVLPIPAAELQQLLEEADVQERLERLVDLLNADLQHKEMREEVHLRLQNEIAASQREMYLREQIRVIQQELGDSDAAQQEQSELREKIHAAKLPPETQAKALKELARLSLVPPLSPESGVIHTYLDRLLSLPWHTASPENLDLDHAAAVLEGAHHGLHKVKARILEHIAVRRLTPATARSAILCFVGPPGVGKTSLGKSIAAALCRKFLRISLGGVRDEAEIRGHRRTYIGALPGRILQQMQRAETINPVFMLDEIDKMSADFRGSPAAALLEVLDPEQNKNFIDHYLEVPYDLSQVTFITTANDLYALPEALEDRLEVIELKGYSEEEKIQIARRFLIPKQLAANGITAPGIHFRADALQHIIRHYTYESGVRNLEREIANVCRKTARLLAADKRFPRRISPALIEKYLGPPQVLAARVNRRDAIGIASGLVWTPSGGDIQTIEVALVAGKGSLMLTGQLGDVLQESAHIALSYLRSRAQDFDLPPDDFENVDAHIHLPEGAVPKDGPSAGMALAAALISAFTEAAIRSDFAMSGEITLRGHILPVGGIAEKVMAARRRGIVKIILPKDNAKDLHDLPKAVTRAVSVQFVDDMRQVIDLLLLAAPPQRQRDIDAAARQPASAGESSGTNPA